MNNQLEEFIKIYPSLNNEFCKKIITELKDAKWQQHFFYNPYLSINHHKETTANSLSKLLPNLVSSKGKIYESTTRYRRFYHILRNGWWRGKSNFSKAGDDGHNIWLTGECDDLCCGFCWHRLHRQKSTR